MDSIDQPPVQNKHHVGYIVISFVMLAGFLALITAGYIKTTSGSPSEGSKIPGFALTTFDRQTMRTADLSGKVIVVNFWASWCQPCEDEAALLEEAWQKYKSGSDVVFLGVDYMDTEIQALKYLKKNPAGYPNGPDAGGRISSAFRVRGVPETYIFDRNGQLAYSLKGPFTSTADIISVVDSLITEE